jgi:hypothetical protein
LRRRVRLHLVAWGCRALHWVARVGFDLGWAGSGDNTEGTEARRHREGMRGVWAAVFGGWVRFAGLMEWRALAGFGARGLGLALTPALSHGR